MLFTMLRLGHLVMTDCSVSSGIRPKPFHFAIVDEVDSVLIDEGRNPLLISGEVICNCKESAQSHICVHCKYLNPL